MSILSIAGRLVGEGHPCFIIAEAGVNHNGSVEIARKLVEVAARAGADAIKFQSFRAEGLVTADAPKAEYQRQTTDARESQYDMLRRLELSGDAHRGLMDSCREHGILFMSTPFDEESANFLADLGVAVFKMASGEITNLPFLAHVASKRKPLIVSTGMSDLGEVATAVRTIEEAGNRDFALLHCVSCYPADAADANLRAMQTMAAAFRVPVGFSDHTLGLEVSLAAAALGAAIIEKHFTLDQTWAGPDHQASLEPDELAALVRGVRRVEHSLGDGRKMPTPGESNTAAVVRKSLVAAQDLTAGTRLTERHIAIKRPGTGLAPSIRCYLIGRTLRVDVPAGTLFALGMLE